MPVDSDSIIAIAHMWPGSDFASAVGLSLVFESIPGPRLPGHASLRGRFPYVVQSMAGLPPCRLGLFIAVAAGLVSCGL